MALKKIELQNKGMSQDMSISKSVHEYAFENHNIRIQALDDSTLISITNIKGPKDLELSQSIEGHLLGKCKCNDCIVLFTKTTNTDYIYKLDYKDPMTVTLLFKGNLNFKDNSFIDTLFYYENSNVQKVYFVDGVNKPRFINIMKKYDEANDLEFYPTINSLPSIEVEKDYSIASQLPSGIIQYFVSYYNKNGAETLIANASSTCMIDFPLRGGKADETCPCGFNITLNNLDPTFDCVRIYSAIRTTQEGEILLHIVGDFNLRTYIKDNKKYCYPITVQDGGINQETLEASQLFYIGGTPFIAKTISQKDGTAFFGNLKTEELKEWDKIKNLFSSQIEHVIDEENDDEHYWSKLLKFYREDFKDTETKEDNILHNRYKNFTLLPNDYNSNYRYKRQTYKEAIKYKTFKAGEIYRFGIQFQSKEGKWSPVIWIGDQYCESYPKFDDATHTLYLNNACFALPQGIQRNLKSLGYDNYRIVFAEPENQNGRKILAQGLVCPTMFTPGQRATNAPYALSSWIMRPRMGNVAYHHFEPLFAAEETDTYSNGSELWSYQLVDNYSNIDNKYHYTKPYVMETITDEGDITMQDYVVTFLSVNRGAICGRTVKFKSARKDYNFDDVKGFYNGSQYFDIYKGFFYDDPDPSINYATIVFDKIESGTAGHMSNKGFKAFLDEMEDSFSNNNIDIKLIPSLKAVQELADKIRTNQANAIGAAVALFAAVIAALLVAAFSMGVASAGSAAILAAAIAGTATIIAGSTAGVLFDNTDARDTYGLSDADIKDLRNQSEALSAFEKDFICRNYLSYKSGPTKVFSGGDKKDVEHQTLGIGAFNPLIFEPAGFSQINVANVLHLDNNYTVHMCSISSVPKESYRGDLIKNQMFDYFVDESIVSFHTPDIEELYLNDKSAKFRIVGIAPIDNTYSNFDMQAENLYQVHETVLKDNLPELQSDDKLLTADYLFLGTEWGVSNTTSEGDTPNDEVPILGSDYAKYKIFMWDKSGSIIGADGNAQVLDRDWLDANGNIDILKDKVFFNEQFSYKSIYLDNEEDRIVYNPSTLKLFTNDLDAVQLLTGNSPHLYYGNYANLITTAKDANHKLNNLHIKAGTTQVEVTPLINGQVDMKFNSTSHLIFDLNKDSNCTKYLLPYFEGYEQYKGVSTRKEFLNDGWQDYTEYDISDANIDKDKSIIDCWTSKENLYYEDAYFIDAPWIEDTNVPWLQHVPTTQYNDWVYDSDKNKLYHISTGQTVGLGGFLNSLSFATKAILYNFYKMGKPVIIGFKKGKGASGMSQASLKPETLSTIGYVKLKVTNIDRTEETSYNFINVTYEIYDNDSDIYIRNNEPNKRFTYTNKEGLRVYKGFPINYIAPTINQDILTLNSKGNIAPYIFIGELYKDIKHKNLYGGFDENQMNNLIWVPASPVTPLSKEVTSMEGDTYFQRWDCLKTYPKTEEEYENKVVDITSCMLETHFNLDERTDGNRANFNMYSRPTNFDLRNYVYNFKNDLFTYTTSPSELLSNNYPNQFTWSLAKNYLGKVDTWTGISLASVGECKYPITKIINSHNNLIALTEHSLEVINFNAKNLINGGDGSFIELANSGKVDGTVKMSYPYGTYNSSVIETERGLYFIDDNTKVLILLSDQGISKIGDLQMDRWFKQNVIQGTFTYSNQEPFHLEYDDIHKDLYIINKDYCLIYNERLSSFVSFIDFEDTYCLFNFEGNTYSIYSMAEPKVSDLFGGDYNTTYGGRMIDYSLQYRVSPSPASDKVFTNIEFIADCGVDDINSSKTLTQPFNRIKVWNEYQETGEQSLHFIRDHISNLKQKFRIWRADIPRDVNSKFKRDRIRNPWIHLTLKRDNSDMVKEKMELHTLNIQYID